MKYSHKSIIAVFIGVSSISFPLHAGRHSLLIDSMDKILTKSVPLLSKNNVFNPQAPISHTFKRNFFSLSQANPHFLLPFKSPLKQSSNYKPVSHYSLTDFFLQFKQSSVRQYSTNQSGPFLDPKNDIAFKKLFGTEDHKPLLINFLNSLLRLEGTRTIKDVELLPTEQIPHIKAAKRAILDVKCTDQRNLQYIVEMQNRRVPNFIKRSQYYVSNTYASQLGDAVDYIELKPVILLTIANHNLFPEKLDYISYHKTLDTKTHEHDLEDLSYAFVELPKFKKTEGELKSSEDQWLYMFKNYDKVKEISKEIPQEIQEAYKTLQQFSWNPEEKEAYDKSRIALADEFDALRAASEEGIAKGIVQGINEERRSIAHELLKLKEPDEKIIKITKITPRELEQIKSDIEKKK